MEDKNSERENEQRGQSSSGAQNQSGDPGRTPGTAEGDRETIEQDLREDEGRKKG